MKKTLATIACLATLTLGTSALATPFQISETTVDFSALGVGLYTWDSYASNVFDLDEGEYFDFTFGEFHYPLALAGGNVEFEVSFTAPELANPSGVGTFAVGSIWIFSARGLSFGDPIIADYSYNGNTGGQLQLDFNDIDFDIQFGSSDFITGRITNLADATVAPVPEPGTMLLFGAGLLGLVGYNRKRSNKKA